MTETPTPSFFEALTIGALTMPNRVIMARLTRSRATREDVPTNTMIDYYAQRASAGLIVTEAISISRQGAGFTYTPGIWRDDQVEAWRPIVDAVHARGGLIMAQLAHNGRAGHSEVIGEQPVSASATVAPVDARTYEGPKPSEVSRPLAIEEIPASLKTTSTPNSTR